MAGNNIKSVPGNCHCGNISFVLCWPGLSSEIRARACSCTFCSKHGGIYTSHPDAELSIGIEKVDYLNRYTFGTATAEFYICTACGVVPVVSSKIDEHLYAVVNVNTIEGIGDIELITHSADFESEDTRTRLDRRKRTWIPRVEINYGMPRDQ